jgi:hypothetical protein
MLTAKSIFEYGMYTMKTIVFLILVVLNVTSCGVGGYYINMDEEDIRPSDLQVTKMEALRVFMTFDSSNIERVDAGSNGMWSVNEDVIEPVVRSSLTHYNGFIFTESPDDAVYSLDVKLYDFFTDWSGGTSSISSSWKFRRIKGGLIPWNMATRGVGKSKDFGGYGRHNKAFERAVKSNIETAIIELSKNNLNENILLLSEATNRFKNSHSIEDFSILHEHMTKSLSAKVVNKIDNIDAYYSRENFNQMIAGGLTHIQDHSKRSFTVDLKEDKLGNLFVNEKMRKEMLMSHPKTFYRADNVLKYLTELDTWATRETILSMGNILNVPKGMISWDYVPNSQFNMEDIRAMLGKADNYFSVMPGEWKNHLSKLKKKTMKTKVRGRVINGKVYGKLSRASKGYDVTGVHSVINMDFQKTLESLMNHQELYHAEYLFRKGNDSAEKAQDDRRGFDKYLFTFTKDGKLICGLFVTE